LRQEEAVSDPIPAAVQDFYPDDYAHCYGCGRLNPHGLHICSRWDGDEVVAHFTPQPYHVAVPGFVYGGLLASLIDCHGIATASAASERAAGRTLGQGPAPRFVTAALHVDYLRPTPLGPVLEVRGRVTSLGERKVVVAVSVSADGTVTARGEVVAVLLPTTMGRAS
jgi:acyl-coenzyme A thioesterase PaaI-like protein